MDQAERMALAVRAHVARIRAEQAGERATFLEHAVQPTEVALERFRRRYGRTASGCRGTRRRPARRRSAGCWRQERAARCGWAMGRHATGCSGCASRSAMDD